jgi:molybdopterin converting factor small subunit
MHVRVKLFATLRQYLPPETAGNACVLDVPPDTRAIDVLSRVGLPVDRPGYIVILVNGRQGGPDQVLEEGDTVSVFPAMAGG